MQAEGGSHKVFVIGRKANLVGIADAFQAVLDLAVQRIEKDQIIAGRIGHNQIPVVRGRHQVVWLFADRKARGFLHGRLIYQAHRALTRVEHHHDRSPA